MLVRCGLSFRPCFEAKSFLHLILSPGKKKRPRWGHQACAGVQGRGGGDEHDWKGRSKKMVTGIGQVRRLTCVSD